MTSVDQSWRAPRAPRRAAAGSAPRARRRAAAARAASRSRSRSCGARDQPGGERGDADRDGERVHAHEAGLRRREQAGSSTRRPSRRASMLPPMTRLLPQALPAARERRGRAVEGPVVERGRSRTSPAGRARPARSRRRCGGASSLRRPHSTWAANSPTSASATASAEVPSSCAPVASMPAGIDGSRKLRTPCVACGISSRPAKSAPTASTPIVQSIENGPSPCPACASPCRRAYSLGGAVEHEQHQPERVERGHERADQAEAPDGVADPVAARERVGEDLVLREEARERRHAGQRERADPHHDRS